MPVTQSDIPNLLKAGLKTLFFDSLQNGLIKSAISKVASVVESSQDTENYAWLGQNPIMKEFLDERQIKALQESSFSIRNKTWEATIGVDRTAIEDDRYGQIKVRIQSLAYEAIRHKEQMIISLLANGFTNTCYDGQYFFDIDHVNPGADYQSAQSNKGTDALSAASLQSAITAMSKVKDDKGRSMGVSADTIVVPPDLEWTARELLESVYYPEKLTGTDNQKNSANPLKNRLGLVISPYLTDTNNWYLLCTQYPVKPLILQERTNVEFRALESESESGFMRDQYLYGIRARYNAGYGLWQYAYGAIVA